MYKTMNDETPSTPVSPPSSDSSAPTSTATESAPSPTAPADASPPSARIQIGTQREGKSAAEIKAKPVSQSPSTPQEAPPEKKHYPPPNTRGELSPELEAEYLAALGGQSLDDVMASEAEADTMAELVPDTRIQGTVAKIYREDIFIDLGGRNQGVVSSRQFDELPEVGSTLELSVARFNADDGLYELTVPNAAVTVADWGDVAEGQVLEVVITGSNKGGLECEVSGIRGFIPMGQVSLYRVETPEEFVGQKLACVVTEANPDRRNLVLSHRAIMERERAEKRDQLLAELAPGQVHEGTVRSIRDFGAFVDLGGIDGLIHVSKLSWERVNHPNEVLTEGQAIKVRVDKVDKETGRIGLSYRDVGANPWDDVESKYPVGNRLMGTVTRIADFGAFVKLEPGIEGLVHISELSHGRVHRVADVLAEGQEMEVKILSVDRDAQRISLSMRALMPVPEKSKGSKPSDEDLAVPADSKLLAKKPKNLKGGRDEPSGGEQFGLNW